MAAHAARGKQALDNKDFATAIEAFSAAIQEAPTSPEFYLQRSIAHLRLDKLDESLADADQAVLNGQTRAKKEAITEGQFRRGVALYRLGRVADAEYLFEIVKKRDGKHKQADAWTNNARLALGKLPADDEKRKVTVTETPHPPSTAHAPPSVSSAAIAPVATQPTPATKIRYEWYQNSENIYFTLLAKGVPHDKCHVEIKERSLSVSFPITGGASYDLHIEPLFAPVALDKCITRVLPTKLEIVLHKAQPAQKWSVLELEGPVEPAPIKDPNSAIDTPSADDAAKRAAPAYPTSSKSGPKDWDKLARELRTTGGDGKASAAAADDDDEDEIEGGDPANHFFKKLFKGASPETQRAMMKSYVESNGTALSTNWDEVSKSRVETVPPDGMEAKSWTK
jgi:suppressor of G2 allele of SKP1